MANKMSQSSNCRAKETSITYCDDESDTEAIDYLFSDDDMDDGTDDEVFDYEISDTTFDAEPEEKKPYWRLRGELASWACTSGKANTLSSLTDLCKVLRPYGFSNLPRDSRSLMNTPRESNPLIRKVFPGQYIHIGVQIGIEFQLKQNLVDVSQITELVIDCDMDGVRICKSSTRAFWPIWCRIRVPWIGEPFLVGNYVGKGAPKDFNLYVYDFVKEFKKLMMNGLLVGDKTIIIRFGRFIGDSPGRCDTFGLKGTTGYYGCPRCMTEGTRHNNRTCFPQRDAPLRTNQNFRDRVQPEHHRFTSLLESELGVECITQVPLDSMHLLYAGVTNRLLYWMVTDEVNFKFKLSASQINDINNKLEIAVLSQPKEFSRPVTDIRQHKQFKCTQRRLFLLYLSIVVLKGVFTKFQYEHFLLLFVGVRILSDDKHFKLNNSVAKNMLSEYVKILGSHFGAFRLIYSFHMLIHLPDEVLMQDEPLDRFAMWEFETANAKLKNFTRRQGAYLQQSYNRTIEQYQKAPEIVSEVLNYPTLKLEMKRSRNKKADQSKKYYIRIEFEKFMLDTTYGNRWFLTKSGDIYKFEQAIQIKSALNTQIKIQGRTILNKHNFFEKPIFSSFLNIFECSDKKLSQPIELDVIEVEAKVFMIQNEDKMVFIPLLK
ncbi:hypothetical protein HA402_004551 [Bradysia odoriphaga]|nr:hypothetical protein HA402_004551 [Bradysia odoriphaga]